MTEKKYEVDFQDVFERVPEPTGVCDEDGWVHSLNSAARTLLEPHDGERLRLHLGVRETVRQMRMTEDGLQEFFMADVQVEGARNSRASVSLLPLKNGGYRVAFEASPHSGLPSNLRLLESLVNVNRHLELFKSADKVVALFASSFSEVFPDYSFHMQVKRPRGAPMVYQHAAWEKPAEHLESAEGERLQFWSTAAQSHRVDLQAIGAQEGFLQVESREDKKFSVAERDAFEAFAQQVSFALGRLWHREDYSQVAPIIDQLDAVVLICDERRRIRVCNQTFESLVYDDHTVGRDLLDFFSESSRAAIRTAAATVMAGGDAEPIEAALVNGDGEGSSQVILTIQVAANQIGREAGQGFIVTGQQNELSLVELEKRLNRAEHLMNIGQLATGVAHELKNPLTSILNYADYLLRKYEDSLFEDRDRDRLRRIIKGVEQIDAFVQDLVALARPNEEASDPVDIHSVIRESGMLCELTLREHQTDLHLELYESSALVRGSHNQLKQVFVNLISNAATAMDEDGGNITIRVEASKDWLDVNVVDDGKGMHEEILQRIFEPFFTTRDGHGGTGLGLAIVQSIITRHEGAIEVDSEPGAGTSFRIRLPRVD